jgi:hypothetical protein
MHSVMVVSEVRQTTTKIARTKKCITQRVFVVGIPNHPKHGIQKGDVSMTHIFSPMTMMRYVKTAPM